MRVRLLSKIREDGVHTVHSFKCANKMLFLINMEGWSEIALKVGHIEFSQFI